MCVYLLNAGVFATDAIFFILYHILSIYTRRKKHTV